MVESCLHFFFDSGLKATADGDGVIWPCESSHRITVSLDRMKPFTISLPHPILPESIKASLKRKEGVVEVVASKALPNDLWPEDVVGEQYRWNADNLEQWSEDALLPGHFEPHLPPDLPDSRKLVLRIVKKDALTSVRYFVVFLFRQVTRQGRLNFKVLLNGKDTPEDVQFYLRAHPPVRISPRGTPILLFSVEDQQLALRLVDDDILDVDEVNDAAIKVFEDNDPSGITRKKRCVIYSHSFDTIEEINLLRTILRLNSTKIQPTSWQKKNVPLSEPTAWLATFLRPL